MKKSKRAILFNSPDNWSMCVYTGEFKNLSLTQIKEILIKMVVN